VTCHAAPKFSPTLLEPRLDLEQLFEPLGVVERADHGQAQPLVVDQIGRDALHVFAGEAVENTISEPPLCDVAIIFSHDTDLVPVVQTISRLRGTSHVETASWVSETYSARLRVPGARVYHHELTRDIYEAVRDGINYAHRG
jgi:hypothetical protein